MIQPGDTHETVELYKTIIDFRQEDVANPADRKLSLINIIFKKPVSVFASWHTDTETIRDKCLEYDFENWKLVRVKAAHMRLEPIQTNQIDFKLIVNILRSAVSAQASCISFDFKTLFKPQKQFGKPQKTSFFQ